MLLRKVIEKIFMESELVALDQKLLPLKQIWAPDPDYTDGEETPGCCTRLCGNIKQRMRRSPKVDEIEAQNGVQTNGYTNYAVEETLPEKLKGDVGV